MMMKDYLKTNFAEAIPAWMLKHKPGDKINAGDVLNSRLVYYPGARYDGQPIHTFVQSHAAHVFMYVDYMISKADIQEELTVHGFRGYHVFDSADVAEKDLTPTGWTPHVHPSREDIERMRRFCAIQPGQGYAFLTIFERDAEYGEDHGPERFAVIFVGGDGIATYDAIFCNHHATAPFCLVLQDHGFGGNWNAFGADGMLEQAAGNAKVFPQYILAATDNGGTKIWHKYAKIPGVPAVLGGQNHGNRELFRYMG